MSADYVEVPEPITFWKTTDLQLQRIDLPITIRPASSVSYYIMTAIMIFGTLLFSTIAVIFSYLTMELWPDLPSVFLLSSTVLVILISLFSLIVTARLLSDIVSRANPVIIDRDGLRDPRAFTGLMRWDQVVIVVPVPGYCRWFSDDMSLRIELKTPLQSVSSNLRLGGGAFWERNPRTAFVSLLGLDQPAERIIAVVTALVEPHGGKVAKSLADYKLLRRNMNAR